MAVDIPLEAVADCGPIGLQPPGRATSRRPTVALPLMTGRWVTIVPARTRVVDDDCSVSSSNPALIPVTRTLIARPS